MEDKRELLNNEETTEPSVLTSSEPPPVYTPQFLPQAPPGYRAGYPGQVQQQQYQYRYPAQYVGQGMPGGAPTQVVVVRHTQGPPPDYMVMAILVTVFCCLPFGIVGIIKAIEAKDLHAGGNYQGAMRASESAGKWTKAGLISGIIICCLCTAFVFLWVFIIGTIDYDDY